MYYKVKNSVYSQLEAKNINNMVDYYICNVRMRLLPIYSI